MTLLKTNKDIFESSNPHLEKSSEENWENEPGGKQPFNVYAKQCAATSKSTGARCKRVAVTGYNVCRLHGANIKNKGGVSKGTHILNDFALKTGAYSCRFMEEFERISFQVFTNSLLEHLGDWNIADLALAQTAGLIHIRITRAITQTDEAATSPRAVEDLSKSMTRVLKALGITREGQKPKGKEEKSFAELALDMIQKAKSDEPPDAKPKQKSNKSRSNILPKPEKVQKRVKQGIDQVSAVQHDTYAAPAAEDSVFD